MLERWLLLGFSLGTLMACGDAAGGEGDPAELEVEQHRAPLTFAPCNGSVRVQLDGTHDASYNAVTNYVYDNGTSFNPALKGPFPSWDPDYYQRAWFSPSLTYYGLQSLTYQLRRCSQAGDCAGYTTQKIHHHLLKNSGNLVSVASPARRYAGFAFRVDGYSEPSEDLGQISGTPLVFQMWQGSPHRPPFAAHLVPAPSDRIVVACFFLFPPGRFKRVTNAFPSKYPLSSRSSRSCGSAVSHHRGKLSPAGGRNRHQ
jgi:hypothetical protein